MPTILDGYAEVEGGLFGLNPVRQRPFLSLNPLAAMRFPVCKEHCALLAVQRLLWSASICPYPANRIVLRDSIGARREHDGARSAHDGAGSAHDGAGSAHDGARRAHDGARRAHDGARSVHDGAGSAPDGAGSAHDGARRAHDGARSAHDGARSAAAALPLFTFSIAARKSALTELRK